jgi:hypothetical protein
MAGSRANVNDFLLGRDNGEGQPRTTRPDEMWHIDTTVIRLLDGTRA